MKYVRKHLSAERLLTLECTTQLKLVFINVKFNMQWDQLKNSWCFFKRFFKYKTSTCYKEIYKHFFCFFHLPFHFFITILVFLLI